jgi:hypothetical protein
LPTDLVILYKTVAVKFGIAMVQYGLALVFIVIFQAQFLFLTYCKC